LLLSFAKDGGGVPSIVGIHSVHEEDGVAYVTFDVERCGHLMFDLEGSLLRPSST
jgi:hypothetical protein